MRVICTSIMFPVAIDMIEAFMKINNKIDTDIRTKMGHTIKIFNVTVMTKLVMKLEKILLY